MTRLHTARDGIARGGATGAGTAQPNGSSAWIRRSTRPAGARTGNAGAARQAAFEQLLDASLRRIDVGFPVVETAVRLRAKHYHRERTPLSLADCIGAASAGSDGAVATADEAMLAMAEADEIRSVALAA